MRDDGLWLENEKKRPPKLENEAQIPSKALPEASWRPKGALGALWGWFWRPNRCPQGAPEPSWAPLGSLRGRFEGLSGSFLEDFFGPGRHLKQKRRNA